MWYSHPRPGSLSYKESLPMKWLPCHAALPHQAAWIRASMALWESVMSKRFKPWATSFLGGAEFRWLHARYVNKKGEHMGELARSRATIIVFVNLCGDHYDHYLGKTHSCSSSPKLRWSSHIETPNRRIRLLGRSQLQCGFACRGYTQITSNNHFDAEKNETWLIGVRW